MHRNSILKADSLVRASFAILSFDQIRIYHASRTNANREGCWLASKCVSVGTISNPSCSHWNPSIWFQETAGTEELHNPVIFIP
jgi:hypothetical protein